MTERRDAETDLHRKFNELANIDMSDVNYDSDQTDALGDSDNFRLAQRQCKTLEHLWTRARTGSSELQIIGGLLYKKIPVNITSTNEYALVVPQVFTHELITLAHDNMTGGHMGCRKTKQRIEAYFYWPQMHKMISSHVRSCHQCQLVKPLKVKERQPLEPITIRTHAWSDISIDVLGGDLPRSNKGNKYLLVVLCNASKFVHAIPIRNLRAQTIATKLVEFFCFIGLPRTIRCDNMGAFRSHLFKAVNEQFGIDLAFSAPMHYESHGGVERVQATIEHMLRKFIHNNPKEWCSLLPFLLMAIREIPHSSTQFSPSELVFGHKMRGLMAVVRDKWTNDITIPAPGNVSTLKYMQDLQRKIQTALNSAQDNVSTAQKRMKDHYDKKTTERQLEPGDLVMVLLPTSSNKLLTTWGGPHKISRRLTNNNYEIDMGRRKAILHINNLRKYYLRDEDTSMTTMFVTEDMDHWTDSMTANTGTGQVATSTISANDGQTQFTIGRQLTEQQQRQLTDLLSEYTDEYSETTHKCDFVRNTTRLAIERPIWQEKTIRTHVWDRTIT